MSATLLEEVEVSAGRPRTHGRHRRERPGPLARLGDRLDARSWLVIGLGGLLALPAFALGLGSAPDFTGDEVLYTVAGRNVLELGSIAWGGTPILVHPPLFFAAVALWLGVTGHGSGDLVPAVLAARQVGVLFDVVLVVLAGASARQLVRARGGRRVVAVLAAMALVATNPFLLRFGRTALIEPMVLALVVGTLWVAYRLRGARASRYVLVVGVLGGLAILTKAPAAFLLAGPLVAAGLRRDARGVGRALGALAVSVVVWSVFPVWAVVEGHWTAFREQSLTSLERLVGALQVTGLHRSGVSPVATLAPTVVQYAAGYALFALGAVVLAVQVGRMLHSRRALDEAQAHVLGAAATSFAFLGYSVAFGQANEQLSVYTVPASAVLLVTVWADRGARTGLRRAVGALLVVVLAGGLVSGATTAWSGGDDATTRTAAWIRANVPACVPVNATGDGLRWQAALDRNLVTEHRSGPAAATAGVQVFLLSPKDARLGYGVSSPQLQAWVEGNGREVFSTVSRTYEEVSVWVVGTLPATGYPAGCPAAVPAATSTTGSAPALVFGALLLGVLAVLGGAGAVAEVRHRRRRALRGAGAVPVG